MKISRALIIVLILSLYPWICYVIRNTTIISPDNLFGIFYSLFLLIMLSEKFLRNESVRIPNYLIFFSVFVLYRFLTAVMVSDLVAEKGIIKFLYHDSYLRTLFIMLIVENTFFPPKMLEKISLVLFGTLILAVVVSIIQVSDPLFFIMRPDEIESGLSYERLQQLSEGSKEYDISSSLFSKGYRPSIYSWISTISVGIDGIAIFSILYGLKGLGKKAKGILLLAAGLMSFLSSARWIMLNFILVSIYPILVNKNKFVNGLKYLLLIGGLGFIIIQSASYFGVDIEDFFYNRLMSESANTRIYAFEVFGKVFPKHPLFGTGGVDTEEMLKLIAGRSSQIHVGWLKLLYYFGAIGGMIYIIFIGTFLHQLWQRANQVKYWGGFFAIFAFVVANLTLVELDLFHHGLMLALIFSKNIEGQKINDSVNPFATLKPVTATPKILDTGNHLRV